MFHHRPGGNDYCVICHASRLDANPLLRILRDNGKCSQASVSIAESMLQRSSGWFDGYGTTQTVYGTTPVGCKGGTRYVEGCWGFPYLKIKKCKVSRVLFFGFLVSTKTFVFSKGFVTYDQMPIPCFSIYIDLISMILKNTRICINFRRAPFRILKLLGFPNFEIYNIMCFRTCSGNISCFLQVSSRPKLWINMTQKGPTNLGDPTNEKGFCCGRARFGFLHFHPEIFYMISSFSTFASKVSYSGIKDIFLLGQMCQSWIFGLIFASPNLRPIKEGPPTP